MKTIVFLFLASAAVAAHPDLPDPEFGFRSFCVAWGGTTNAVFERFLREARPEIVQCGFYGPMFHGYADDPRSTGYPMQLPVSGQRAALAVQREVNRKIRKLGLKVVGHFQTVNAIADPGRTNGFLAFYETGWPEDLLGPRPHPDVRELLMRDAAGNVLSNVHYVTYVGLCPNSPYARACLKAMLKLAVSTGLDGVMANYNYNWGCACPHCQAGFRRWLGERYSADELKTRFGIADLASHTFAKIAAQIPGYPADGAPELDWEAMRWGAVAFKRAFDEVYLEYGRQLKKDLIVATWNHLGDVGVTEERAFLPLELWGRGEHYFWYSGGTGPTKPAERKLGDGWVNGLYIRELGRGKPFMLGKYEGIRMRNSVAEALATGGSGMGLTMGIAEPAGFRGLSAYLRFPRDYAFLYKGLEPDADAALVYPRREIQSGNRLAAEQFRDAGRALSERQVVFEAVADGLLDSNRLARFGAVLVPAAAAWDPPLRAALEAYANAGGAVHAVTAETVPGLAERLQAAARWRIEAPWTVKAMAWRGPGRRVLHLVNYDRDEAAAARLPQNPAAECPVPVSNAVCRLVLPAGARVSRVVFYAPEADRPLKVSFHTDKDGVRFAVPPFEVYGVAEIRGRGF